MKGSVVGPVREASMDHMVSKSKFKASALRYFREVEEGGEPLIITDRGRPVLKIVPCDDGSASILEELRDSVKRYEKPTEPIGEGDWEVLG